MKTFDCNRGLHYIDVQSKKAEPNWAGLQARILLQVHDELVLEVQTDQLHTAAHLVQEVMEGAYDLKVPLQTEARSGLNWGTMIPIISSRIG